MRNLVAAVLLVAAGTVVGCASDADTRVWKRHESQRKGAGDEGQPRQVITASVPPGEALVFCFFRAPTESPLYLATSRDGYTWEEAGGPVFTPQAGPYRGLRDPVIERGPDGVYHMVFTWGIHNPRGIGYASSRDLLNWTDVRSLEVWPADVPSEACWAPELFYDEAAGHWLIVWSSEITGKFPETDKQSDANHRLYACTTKDFRTLSPAELFFDPGYTVIDPDLVEMPGGGGVVMFFKDERDKGQAGRKKQVRFVTGPGPRGPWSEPSAAITVRWAEGPSALRLGDGWIVYFDEYQSNRYGAVRSPDLLDWADVSKEVSFPEGMRHGSALRVPLEVANRLRAR